MQLCVLTKALKIFQLLNLINNYVLHLFFSLLQPYDLVWVEADDPLFVTQPKQERNLPKKEVAVLRIGMSVTLTM